MRLSKRKLASQSPYLQRRIESLKQDIKDYHGGVETSFSVYKNQRDKNDIGGMIGDLARAAKYKRLAQVAEQELNLLEKANTEEDWKKIKDQVQLLRDWRSDVGELAKLEANALSVFSEEYSKRCPKSDKLPHEVLNIKL